MPPIPHLISVIIPVYNGERFLAEAIESVRAQNYAPLEIIIVDDGSTDGTAAVVRQLDNDIHYVYQANAGPAAARNRGLQLARGKMIAFLDADDMWTEGRLAQQLNLLEQYPAVLATVGRTRFIGVNLPPAVTEPHWFPGIHIGLYRRAAFETVGSFNESLRFHEDVDWFRRARAAGVIIYPHDEVVLLHRRHANNMTHDYGGIRQHLLRMLRYSPRRPDVADDSLLVWLTTRPAIDEQGETIYVRQ